jgi:protein TonB
MLAYAANRPLAGKRESSPNTLLIIASVHVAAIAALMSAKMDLPIKLPHPPIKIFEVPVPVDPKPLPRKPAPQPTQHDPLISKPDPMIPLPPMNDGPTVTLGPAVDPGPIAGGGAVVTPVIPKSNLTPVHRDARLLTPASQLKPPYPASKLLTEEEATLTLCLLIDENGRVVAVEPIGKADRTFLEAARRHLMARWRYQPATRDGEAVSSSLTITLKFMLDG